MAMKAMQSDEKYILFVKYAYYEGVAEGEIAENIDVDKTGLQDWVNLG